MTTLGQAAQPNERLAAVRRTYVYIVTFISLAVALAGASSLVDTLLRLWLDGRGAGYGAGGLSRGIASSAGLLLVATPIFLVHWGLAQGHRAEAGERASLLRKLFLYGASAWSLAGMLFNAYLLIGSLAELVLGAPAQDVRSLPAQWLSAAVLAALHGALVAYWCAILQQDGDFGREATGGRIVRQLFMLGAGLGGLALLLWGAANALEVGLRLLVEALSPTEGAGWWRTVLAGALTQVLVGGWLAHNNRAQWREIVLQQPSEGQAALRRLYLYAAVVIGAIACLTPAALLLRELLLMLFGDSAGALPVLLNKLVTPLAYAPVGLAIWLWHWRVLRGEAGAFGESRQGATVRRVYYYLMAATGLALLWAGCVELLHVALDAVLTSAAGTGDVWHEPLATGLSLLAVGAPIWALHWRSVQHVARQASDAGAAERNALMRKIYLYGVALIGALILLFQLAQVIYRLLLMLMGDASAPLFSTETAHQLADCLVAGIIWGVHLLAIRNDGRVDRLMPEHTGPEQTGSETPAASSAPVLPPQQRRQALEERRQALAAELAQVEQELAGLPAEERA